jgi:hypothetical protein
MGPKVDVQTQSIETMVDSRVTKEFPQSHIFQSRESSSSHDTLLEVQRSSLSREPNLLKRLPRWIVNSSSSRHNYTGIYMFCLHLVIAILLTVLWLQNWPYKSIAMDNGSSWCMHNILFKAHHYLLFCSLHVVTAPAKDFVQRQITSYWSKHNSISIYGGKPTTEQEAAWDDMLSRK